MLIVDLGDKVACVERIGLCVAVRTGLGKTATFHRDRARSLKGFRLPPDRPCSCKSYRNLLCGAGYLSLA